MKKSAIIKIVSIVLVLCTLLTIFIIPASAFDTSNVDLSSFLFHFPIEKVATRNIKSDGTKEVISSTTDFRLHFESSIKHAIVVSPTVDTYFDLVSYQSRISNWSLEKGDTLTFSLSFLSPWSREMALFVYFEDGTREQYSFRRSDEKVFTNNAFVVNYSGEPNSYAGRVYCHRYTLDTSFVSDGKDIIAIQIQVLYYPSSKINRTWLYYEDCSFYRDKNDSNIGFFNLLASIGQWIKESFTATKEFFLSFGTNIKNAVSPFFNNVSTWISNSTSNIKDSIIKLPDNLKGFFTSLGDRIGGFFTSLGQHIIDLPKNIKGFFTSLGDRISGFFDGISEGIYNWFSETFLGKVLRITNKSKAFISQAGNDVQYAALDDEVGESTEEAAPDDWDMTPRPSFYVDVDYYNSLYPDLVGG